MQPTSAINLCSVELPSKTHQLDFSNIDAQQQYFDNKFIYQVPKNSYQDINKPLRIGKYVDELLNVNYGYFDNSYITPNGNPISKRYYFFITRKDYSAKKSSYLYFEIDYFQTWLFEMNFHQCFVERETVSDDSFGKNIYPESFELGNYVCAKRQYVEELTRDLVYIIGVSDSDNSRIGGVYGKAYSGIKYRLYNDEDIGQLTNYIIELNNDGHGDAIVCLFCYPKDMISNLVTVTSGMWIENWSYDERTVQFQPQLSSFTSQHGIGWTPYNKKLFTYPYNFLQITAPSGANIVLKFENFANYNLQEFFLDGTLVANPKFTLSPKLYDNKEISYEDSIECSGFPMGSWNNDVFANWFAQNNYVLTAQSTNARTNLNTNQSIASNNYNTNTLNNVAQTASNAIGSIANLQLGSAGEALVNGWATENTLNNTLQNSSLQNNTTYQNEIRTITAQIATASVQPNQAKGDTSASGLDLARGSNTFFINQMQVKGEIAKMIDMYFQMYGYQVNVVKTPSFKNRTKWDYIKTIGCNISGNIPFDHVIALQSIFDNGLTVWHDYSYRYQYDTQNLIRT